MASRLSRLIIFLVSWANLTSALVFTNSFDGWVGNSTHTLTWNASDSDPKHYDLTLARPHDISGLGVAVDAAWPMDWSMTVATHISSSGDHVLDFILPQGVWPGVYYWVMQSDTNVPITTTFFISSSEVINATSIATSTAATNTSLALTTPGTTTVQSFVQVTATQSAIATSNGHLVTVKPSDVFSSAVVYTTIIVESGGGDKGTPPGKIHLIVGLVLGILFLLTLPIIVWLILRYRRRPAHPSQADDHLDKQPHPSDTENVANSSTLDLLEPSTATSPSAPTGSTRQVWVIVDGEKRAMTVPRHPPRPAPSTNTPDPFADPVRPHVPSRPQLPRLSIPGNPAQSSSSPPSTAVTATPNETTPSGASTTTPHTIPSPMYLRDESSSVATARIEEKVAQARRQRPAPPPRVLSPDEVAARIFVPGRAVDMGPLGRARAGDVDENGLLPPDYSQATQPISPSHAAQAGPADRR